MTVTELPTKIHVLDFSNADPLFRAISNGLLFSCTDDTLPMITVIQFEFDGTKLQTVSTDRYRLCIEPVELKTDVDHKGQDPFDFLLQREDAKLALALLKGARRDPITLVYDTAGELRIQTLSRTGSYKTDRDHQFVPYKALVPDLADAAPVDRIGFNPKYLADLGKVQTRERVTTLAITTFGPHKPTLTQFDDGPLVLLMPIRLPSAD